MTTWNSLGTVTSLLACAACSLPAMAAEPAAAPLTKQSPVQLDSAQAKQVVRDKETGKLRAPSEEEAAEMAATAKANRAARGLPDPETAAPAIVVRQHAGGMMSAVLGLEHMVTITAARGADGKLVRGHRDAAHEHPTAMPATRDQRPTE